MTYTTFGPSNLTVSTLCLGGGSFGDTVCEAEAFALLDAFAAGGGTFLDTANVYCRWNPACANSSERIIGRWLASRSRKGKMVVATKGGHYDLKTPQISRITRRDIRRDLEESLISLGLERIDLYWLHRDDERMPMEELLGILEELVAEGKIRQYGASNYRLPRLREAADVASRKGWQGFSALSNQWSLAAETPGSVAGRDPTMVLLDKATCNWLGEAGMAMVPYSATAQGFFGKLQRDGAAAADGKLTGGASLPDRMLKAYGNERNLRIYERLLRWSGETGCSVHALSVAALLQAPFPVMPVSGARNPEQVREFLTAADIKLPGNLLEEFGLV